MDQDKFRALSAVGVALPGICLMNTTGVHSSPQVSPEYTTDTLRTLVAWGRYAELFSYDEEAEQSSLEDIA